MNFACALNSKSRARPMVNRVRKVETRGLIWIVEWRMEEMFDRLLLGNAPNRSSEFP